MSATNHLLQIYYVRKVDGSFETFDQNDGYLAKRILGELQPDRVFNQDRIIIAGRYSPTFFSVGQAARIDLVSELTNAEFRALLQNPELRDERDQVRAQNASVSLNRSRSCPKLELLTDRPPNSRFHQDSQMSFEPATRRQNENEPAMERKHQ